MLETYAVGVKLEMTSNVTGRDSDAAADREVNADGWKRIRLLRHALARLHLWPSYRLGAQRCAVADRGRKSSLR